MGTSLAVALIIVIPARLTYLTASGVDLLRLLLVGSLFGTVLGRKATMVISNRFLQFLIAALH